MPAEMEGLGARQPSAGQQVPALAAAAGDEVKDKTERVQQAEKTDR